MNRYIRHLHDKNECCNDDEDGWGYGVLGVMQKKMNDTIKYEIVNINDSLNIITQNDLRLISVYNKYYRNLDKYIDSRSLLLINLHELNLNTIILYCNYAENYNNVHSKDWWINKIPHQREIVETSEDFEKFASDRDYNVLNSIKDDYLLNIFFEFENKIRNIVRQLGSIPNLNERTKSKSPNLIGDEAWYYIWKGFFNSYLSLPNETTEVLELYTALRNTIHNGGFYFNSKVSTDQINFMNQPFIFENLKPIYLTLKLRQDLYFNLIDLIDLAFGHQKLTSIDLIKDPITDVKF